MTITLNITPEVQAKPARKAAASGRSLEAYPASLLEDAMHPESREHDDSEPRRLERRLVAVCAMVAGQTGDVDLRRDPSTWRPLDLS